METHTTALALSRIKSGNKATYPLDMFPEGCSNACYNFVNAIPILWLQRNSKKHANNRRSEICPFTNTNVTIAHFDLSESESLVRTPQSPVLSVGIIPSVSFHQYP